MGDDTEDGVLLERFVATRDEEAFAALVRRHGQLVHGACRRLLEDPNDADDVFQATFVVLARKAGSIRKRGAVGPWLYGVAYRIGRRLAVRSKRRRVKESQVVSTPPIDPAAELVRAELPAVLEEELNTLPEKYRLPLVLCYLEGQTWEEAARALGWPTGSMTRRLEKARTLLAARLTSRGLALSSAALATVLTTSNLSAEVPGRSWPEPCRPESRPAVGRTRQLARKPRSSNRRRDTSHGTQEDQAGGDGGGGAGLRWRLVDVPHRRHRRRRCRGRESDIRLPNDPKAVVISLDHQGATSA